MGKILKLEFFILEYCDSYRVYYLNDCYASLLWLEKAENRIFLEILLVIYLIDLMRTWTLISTWVCRTPFQHFSKMLSPKANQSFVSHAFLLPRNQVFWTNLYWLISSHSIYLLDAGALQKFIPGHMTFFHVPPPFATQHAATLCNTMPHNALLHCAMPRHVLPVANCHPMLCHDTLCHATLCHATLYHAMPRHAMPRHAMRRHAMPRHAMPRHAIPSHAMPRHAMPRYATQRNTTRLISALKFF